LIEGRISLRCAVCGGRCDAADRCRLARGSEPRESPSHQTWRTIWASRLLSADGCCVVTAKDGTIRYWNRGAEALFGWATRDVLGRNVLDVTPSEARVSQAAEIVARPRAGEDWARECERELQRRGRTRFMAWVIDAPITTADGTLLGIAAMAGDASDPRREELAREAETRLSGVRLLARRGD